MYGMVIQGAQDLLVHLGGDELWDRVLVEAGLEETVFVATSTYDDSVVYNVVSAAAAVTGMAEDEVLNALGRHWILYTGRLGWGHMLDMGGNDLRSFVAGLDAMHMRLQSAMIEMRAPSFAVEQVSEDQINVIYQSEREGFAPMVVGLLEALAELFEEQWDVSHVQSRTATSHDVFSLTETVPAAPRSGANTSR